MSAPPAILLGGELIAVSVGRSVAAAGVEVHALGAASDPVRRSRRSFTDLGGGEGVQERWMEWLSKEAPQPAGEPDAAGLARLRRRLVATWPWA